MVPRPSGHPYSSRPMSYGAVSDTEPTNCRSGSRSSQRPPSFIRSSGAAAACQGSSGLQVWSGLSSHIYIYIHTYMRKYIHAYVYTYIYTDSRMHIFCVYICLYTMYTHRVYEGVSRKIIPTAWWYLLLYVSFSSQALPLWGTS